MKSLLKQLIKFLARRIDRATIPEDGMIYWEDALRRYRDYELYQLLIKYLEYYY